MSSHSLSNNSIELFFLSDMDFQFLLDETIDQSDIKVSLKPRLMVNVGHVCGALIVYSSNG